MASSQLNSAVRRLQQQLRQAEQQERRRLQAINDYNRKVQQHNRQVVQAVNDYNRRAADHNRRAAQQVSSHNQNVVAYNRQVDASHQQAIAALNAARRTVRYTPQEDELVSRVRDAVEALPVGRACDVFLSYARIDGAAVAEELREALESLGVSVWFDEAEMKPGQSMARQMDLGLAKARSGVVLLTPAYITGRFWTERELGVLLHKNTVIPVLHAVTFGDVSYSGMLGDLVGFTTTADDVATIAAKIAGAVLPEQAA
jgi:TIR domain